MSDFTSQTVSFGIVTNQIETMLAFYTQALGLTEASTFDVSAEMGGKTGLSDDLPFHVHVLKLGDNPEATMVKLMQFTDHPGVAPDNGFIHSTVGIRYLTIRVADIRAALDRAARHDVRPLAEGPYALREEAGKTIYLAVVQDPDGNRIELIGPEV